MLGLVRLSPPWAHGFGLEALIFGLADAEDPEVLASAVVRNHGGKLRPVGGLTFKPQLVRFKDPANWGLGPQKVRAPHAGHKSSGVEHTQKSREKIEKKPDLANFTYPAGPANGLQAPIPGVVGA